jgi:hypothetical protein
MYISDGKTKFVPKGTTKKSKTISTWQPVGAPIGVSAIIRDDNKG